LKKTAVCKAGGKFRAGKIGSPRPLHFETNTTGNRDNLRPARVFTREYRRSCLKTPYDWNHLTGSAGSHYLPSGVKTIPYAESARLMPFIQAQLSL